MSAGITRAISILAFATIASFALIGCSPKMDISGDGPTEQSVAVLEEFFGHLEAGEPAEAAALTDIDFPSEFVDDAFYAASAAKPAGAHVTETSGDDSHTVTATVEYVLDDPDDPVTATYTVKNTDEKRTVSWTGAGHYGLIMVSSPGRIVLNGTLEFPMSLDGDDLMLLPGLYDISYVDPTGTTQLDADGTNDFTLAYPVEDDPAPSEVPENVNVSTSSVWALTSVEPAVITAVEEEITRLTAACVEEEMTGPSCPPAVREYGHTFIDPSTAEWFQDANNGLGLTVAEGSVQYSVGFTLLVDNKTFPISVVYEGNVTRSEDGTVTYSRTS